MTHRTQLWIGGAWRPAADGRTLVDRNPEDDAPYAEAARAGAADVDAAVDAAQHAFSTYRRTLASEREAWLLKAAQLLEQRADAFADVLIDEIGDRLVEAPAVRAVNFTGSTRVGRHLSALCGRHLKRALLELGGKNPLIILDDADLDAAVQGAVMGMFLYQGQACMASSRILVARPIHEKFMERFAAAARGLSLGALREPSTVIGPIISERQRARIRDHIQDARAKGATLVTGGEWQGNRCRPTILTGVREGMTCFREETFGPVTSVYPVADLDEALALANDSAYGLSAAVYTRNLDQAMKAAQALHAGMVHVNAPTLHDEPHVPFGGVGESGMGREGAVTDIDHCTEWKWVTIQQPGAAHAH